MTRIMDCSLLHNVVTDLLTLEAALIFTDGTAAGFTLVKHIWMLKSLMEALARFGLAIDMLIIFVLSVLSEVRRRGKDLCTWHAEKSQPFDRKQSSATSVSHIHFLTQLNRNH